MFSILYGLSAAAAWGAADFTGGVISRKLTPAKATFFVEIFSLLPVLLVCFLFPQPMLDWSGWLWCGAAGAIGSLGLLLLFRAFADGQMSVAAPVSALMAACLPVLVGSFKDGLPSAATFAGFGLALAAIWLVSRSDAHQKPAHLHLRDLLLPLIAGIGFGCYFIFMNQGSQTSLFWPMVASRTGGTLVLLLVLFRQRQSMRPPRSMWGLLILNGLLDSGGSFFYILAGQSGRMDVAAVLGSLYSGVTVLLAWLLLREKINRVQVFGILSAMLAIILLTI